MTDDEFRDDIRAFIAAELPPEMATRTLLGYHPHKPDVQYWTARLHQRGWSAPNWPAQYGGPGWTMSQRHIFDEESFLAGCPAVNPQAFHLVGPIIYGVGNDAQKRRFLPSILSGEHFWAQGFSEPNAGSDLAALQTRAVRDGDRYIVNGQKIWTSEAQYCDWLFLLARTSTEGRPQAGISFLLVDLKTPGITIRPIVGIEGGHILNEVFFVDVEVPTENLIGEENSGWSYAKQLLGAERTFSAEVPRNKHLIERCRVVAEEEAGVDAASPTPSILKVKGTELVQRIGALLVEALGDEALPTYLEADYKLGPPVNAPGNALAYGAVADFLYRRAGTIYGGSNEVQRNIIAAQLLRA